MDQPSREEIRSLLKERSNWNRWGADDETGAVNLVTPEKVMEAARLVRAGRTFSLSMPWPDQPAPGNPFPADHFMKVRYNEDGSGSVADYYGIRHHGIVSTHIDALCHVWDEDGMWNGRRPSEHITTEGVTWGGIEKWSAGIVTRGVLLDVPGYRGADYVAMDEPVHGAELEAVAEAQGVEVGPGTALAVYAGRDRWEAAYGLYGTGPAVLEGRTGSAAVRRPGLHASCLGYLRNKDCAALLWDMMDCQPTGYDDLPLGVHPAISAYGIALVDSVLLGPLTDYCRANGVYEFLLVLAPLNVDGGTGSPLNPIAIL